MQNKYEKLFDDIETDIYNISKELIQNICKDLNKTNKANELINKYLKKTKSKSKSKSTSIDSNIKKPKNAYLFFIEDMRPKIQKKYHQDKMGQISQKLGKLWNNLESNKKKKYNKLASQDKERYNKEIENMGNKSQTLFNLDDSQTNIDNDLRNNQKPYTTIFTNNNLESESNSDASNSDASNSDISNSDDSNSDDSNSELSSELS